MTKGIKLYVDDLRNTPEGWTGVRTITEASHILSAGLADEVSLDHDICWCTPSFHLGKFLKTEDVGETYFALVYLLIHLPKRLRPSKVNVHTANHEAGKAMAAMLRENGYEVTSKTYGW